MTKNQYPIVIRSFSLDELQAHPKNYNVHSAAQLEDLRESLRIFGQVKPIVVQSNKLNKPYTIVAGHGIVQAARLEGFKELQAAVIPGAWSSTKVLAYLAADNELARHGDPDQVQLAAIIRQVMDTEGAIVARVAAGEANALAVLLSKTMPAAAAKVDMDALWQGMPAFDQGDQSPVKSIIVHFTSLDHYQNFAQLVDQQVTEKTKWIWYPAKERANLKELVAHES